MYANACVVPPAGYHVGRAQAPAAATHGPFSAPEVCAVHRMTLPAAVAWPSMTGVPVSAWFVVATTVHAGFTASDALVSVTAPVAMAVATAPTPVVTSPVSAGMR